MKKESNSGISFFQRYLTVWVIICMLIGIMLGHFLPGMKEALNYLEYAGISIPLAVLIWIMIYPMMMKVDFKSIKNIGKNPKGLFVTWIVNWLIKPFTMYGIASFFFFVVFKTWITPDLATEYLAGAVLLGAAPCTAMVFVWSTLTKGNPAYTVVQVASNDIIILFAFEKLQFVERMRYKKTYKNNQQGRWFYNKTVCLLLCQQRLFQRGIQKTYNI